MKANKEALSISRLVAEYTEEWAPTHISSNPGTLENICYSIRSFLEYLQEELKVTPNTLSHHHFEGKVLEDWKVWLINKRGCSPYTANNRLSAVRGLVNHLSTKDQLWNYLAVEARDVKRAKTVKTHVNGISEKGIAALFAEIDQKTRAGRRDAALFITQYDTACRISELLTLTIENVHLEGEHPYIWVHGKGNKNRPCYLEQRTAEHLRRYIEEYHGSNPNPQHLVFYSPCAAPGTRQLTTDAADKRLRLYAAKAHEKCPDVPLDIASHQLRHSRASHLIARGVNILEVSKKLGHENIETTMRYLDFTPEQKAQVYAVMAPDGGDDKVEKRWLNADGSLKDLCRPKKRRG